MSSSMFYDTVGPRTSGFKSQFAKQRLRSYERYMTGHGGAHGGHLFRATPTSEQSVVRQTTWMEHRTDGGVTTWCKKMGGRIWRRSKYLYPVFFVPFAVWNGLWELTVWEAKNHDMRHYW